MLGLDIPGGGQEPVERLEVQPPTLRRVDERVLHDRLLHRVVIILTHILQRSQHDVVESIASHQTRGVGRDERQHVFEPFLARRRHVLLLANAALHVMVVPNDRVGQRASLFIAE